MSDLDRVRCGCGALLPRYAYRPRPGSTVFYWPGGNLVFAAPEPKERVRLEDSYGEVVHRCTKRSWPKDARFHLDNEKSPPAKG